MDWPKSLESLTLGQEGFGFRRFLKNVFETWSSFDSWHFCLNNQHIGQKGMGFKEDLFATPMMVVVKRGFHSLVCQNLHVEDPKDLSPTRLLRGRQNRSQVGCTRNNSHVTLACTSHLCSSDKRLVQLQNHSKFGWHHK